MKRKALSMVLASAMTLSMIAGCGGSGSADTTANETTEATESTEDAGAAEEATEAPTADVASEGEHELSVYAWDENFNIPALKAAEKAYQAVDSEFTLNIITQSGSQDVEQAVTLAAAAGDYSTLPDIVLFQDHYIQKFVADYPDAWQDIDDAGIDWSNLGAEKISYSTIGGKHYGAPVDNGTAIFAYRTDILDQCGYSIDDVTGISWDRWLEIAKDVHDKTGMALLSMDHSGDDLPYMMLQAEGVSQWTDNTTPNLVGNDKFKKIIEVIVQGANDGSIILANSWSEYTDQTIQGDQVAGVMNGNWIIPTIEQVADNSGKWAITTLPTIDGGKDGYAANGGSSLYVTANCSKPDLAKSFLAYTFGGGEGAIETYDAALTDGGVITTCISAGKSDVYAKGVDFFNGQAIYADIVEMGSHVPVIQQSDFHYNLRTLVNTLITNVQNGNDIDSEIQAAQEQIEFEIAGSQN
ncbi:ABC transporter substrate-binding protein [Butyrivibrio sp. INlla16]|uniref:ABC transporter substrate-binding protein n=1 Tax=Butyrivibrio sp. INlla16 TaxID=1520807 RepID=UPI000888DEBE|nr:ABC transporter substrate-binding protein [Butyrivibrio sp. INlla16]SDB22901.1 lactose/L-arabinose transport system substrate-binding protein [Butyrivibrio sp. INlla16]